MAEMLFTFASYATRIEGSLTPLKGMKRLADTLHPYGVKITWLVSHDSAEALKSDLTEWHDRFGDDIAVMVPHFKGGAPELVAQARAARQRMQKILPWTRADIAGNHVRSRESLESLEAAGFIGLWGFCWEQIEVDDITDRGCPWGFYYLDPAFRTAPNTRPKGLIGMEWTARDLLKAYHSGNPCIYSTDVNDVARSGMCLWRDIEYLKGMFDNYYRNLRYNDLVLYQVHQEAHEMMPEFRCYSEEDCREAEEMLDELADYVFGHAHIRTATLSEAADVYRERNEFTEPSYMLWEDTPTPPYNLDYSRGTPRGPWPKTFLFYDSECQMMFVDGKFEPVCIRNYADRETTARRYYQEVDIPRVRLRSHTRSPYGMDLHLTVEASKAMPFGITIWEDFGPYLLAESVSEPTGTDLIASRILSQELLFLRYNVPEGRTELRVRFNRK